MSIIVVTGAASGIGLACARRLRPLSATLVLADRDEAALVRVSEQLETENAAPTEVRAVRCDVSDPRDVERLADEVRTLGALRGLVHSAGVSASSRAPWTSQIHVNLVGTALVVEALKPLAVAGTAAVCIASLAGHVAGRRRTSEIDEALDDPLAVDLLERLVEAADDVQDPTVAYGLAKYGVIRLVRRQAVAWGSQDARLSSLSPGLVDTPMGRHACETEPRIARMLEETPLRRWGSVDDVASVAAFLLSDGAAFVSGSDVLVDGGYLAAH